ncbi:IPT/TIG domain-containing protein [Agriterribacter sp.]|uniref:IPT/TIG domain-containing protein n=1 Tax=Agriterribacter sp. TaxID=2821509 RepID=UPI002B6F7DB1|nr:IPT/TIG domain-containing protein [Agriterribacter sp.]HRP56328.1 IPT/TIG domain-containing protein [Agriterribacter sp.]
MKIIFNTRLLLLICLTVSIGITASCKKDKATNTGKVELLSFGPAGVQHGDTISFIGNNLNKVTAIELTGVSIPQSSFIQQTSVLIKILVPEEAERGPATLKTPEGDVTSITSIDFDVPVAITSFTTTARPGENITITGTYLNWISSITFGKDVVVTEFVTRSLTELVVTVPADAQTGTLIISTGGTEPLTIETEEELEVALPAIHDFSPNPAERGSNITIRGTNLDLTMGVLFKGSTAPVTAFVSQSATELVVTIPEDANKGKITLLAHSLVAVESDDALELVGDLPPLAPLGLVFYDDVLENGWQKWGGWGGGAVDMDNSDNVRDGDKAIKVTFANDWGGALQLGGGNSSTTGYTNVVFSIFGTNGTEGKQLNVLVAGKEKVITIVEGEWTEYNVPLTDYESPATINEFTLQDRGFAGTIYIDHIGLK